MRVLLPVPEPIPDGRARFIQMMNTSFHLAEAGLNVAWLTGFKKGWSRESVLEYYGLPASTSLDLIGLPMLRREEARFFRFSWHGLFNRAVKKRLAESGRPREKAVLLVRHLKLAEYLLKIKPERRPPLVYDAHEIFHLTTSNTQARSRIEARERFVFRIAEAVVCTSAHLLEHALEAGARPEAVQVVPHGVPSEFLETTRRAPGEYIFYAGGLYPWKGVDALIEAASRLENEKFLIVGGGDRLDELRALVSRLGLTDRVDLIGPRPPAEIPGLLARAKAAVLPNLPGRSSNFSSPLKLFEYLASGAPIAASDLPTFREVLRDRENSLLFEAGNPAALADCLKRLTKDQDLAGRLSERARADAHGYTYAKRAERLGRVFRLVRGES